MIIHQSFHSPHNLINGDAPHVGVLDLPSLGNHRPPIRLFFPATVPDSAVDPKKAHYFINNRVQYILEGFSHIAFARCHTKMFRFVVRPLIWLFSLFFPARYLMIPSTALVTNNSSVKYLPPIDLSLNKSKKSKQRLVVFSHGLTGTGEENSVFCTSLAKRGYVVACIHHRDGSSSIVPMPDGSWKYYEHFPTGENYNPQNRLDQVQVRANEILDTCDWLLNLNCDQRCNNTAENEEPHPLLKDICDNLHKNNVIAAGFSYGAATTVLAATKRPKLFQCAILLDGWFHIGYPANVDINLPPEAFASDVNKGLDIPCLFINSAAFASFNKLYAATCSLAKQISNNRSEMHVIPNTKHQNFVDIVFWIPKWLLKRASKYFDLGSADPYEVHEAITHWTVQFIDKHFQD